MSLRELSSNRDCFLRQNRLSNQLISGKTFKPRALNLNADFRNNKQDPKWGTLLIRKLKEALMRTRLGPDIKSIKTRDFDYSFVLTGISSLSPSVTSALGAHLQSKPLTSKALEAHLLLMPSTTLFSFNQSHSVV